MGCQEASAAALPLLSSLLPSQSGRPGSATVPDLAWRLITLAILEGVTI